MTKQLTRRQEITLREYRAGHVTQGELAREFGISRSAVSQRLSRARQRLGTEPPARAPARRATVGTVSLSGCSV